MLSAKRIAGIRAANIQTALCHYDNALRVFSKEETPVNWAQTWLNISGACHDLGQTVKAREGYHNSLKVFRRETFPNEWAMTQLAIANCEEGETSISALQAALQVLTLQKESERILVPSELAC